MDLGAVVDAFDSPTRLRVATSWLLAANKERQLA
jgi:hypothetical protein